eukprot:gene440-788_t
MELSKVAIESLSHKFRRSQKVILSDVTAVVDKVNSIISSNTDKMTDEEIQKILLDIADMRSNLRRLVTEVSNADAEEKLNIKRCRTRLDYYFKTPSELDIVSDDHIEHRIRRTFILVGDFLLRKGQFDAVERLTRSYDNTFGDICKPQIRVGDGETTTGVDYGLSTYLDMDVFKAAQTVEDQLLMGDVNAALTWCMDHASKLHRVGSSLEFFLRQEQERVAALQFAQTFLGPLVNQTRQREMKRQNDDDDNDGDGDDDRSTSIATEQSRGSNSNSQDSSNIPKDILLPAPAINTTAPTTSSSTSTLSQLSASLTSRGRAQERQRERSRSLGAATGWSSLRRVSWRDSHGHDHGARREGAESEMEGESWCFPSYSPYPFLTSASASATISNSIAEEQHQQHQQQRALLPSTAALSRATQRSMCLPAPQWYNNFNGSSAVSSPRVSRRFDVPVTALHLEEAMRRIVGLLAFQKDSGAVPECYTPSHKEKRFRYLATVFRMEFLRVYSLPHTPPLLRLLKLGIFALKTPTCSSPPDMTTATATAASSALGLPSDSSSFKRRIRRDHALSSDSTATATATIIPPRLRFATDDSVSTPSSSSSPQGAASVLSNRLSVLADALRVLHQHLPGSLLYSSHSNGTSTTSTTTPDGSLNGNDPSNESRYSRNNNNNSSHRSRTNSAPVVLGSAAGKSEQQQHQSHGSSSSSSSWCRNCPVCSMAGGGVAAALPVPSRGSSILICRGSGLVMGQDNPPMALPNGQVYCKQFIFSKATATSIGIGMTKRIFKCPITQLLVDVDEDLRPHRRVHIAILCSVPLGLIGTSAVLHCCLTLLSYTDVLQLSIMMTLCGVWSSRGENIP